MPLHPRIHNIIFAALLLELKLNYQFTGSVLEKHVAQRKSSGTSYSRIFYIGDGNNDYCPSLRLAEKDCVFPRIGYALHRRIQENTSKVKAQVVPWKTASTIMEAVTSST